MAGLHCKLLPMTLNCHCGLAEISGKTICKRSLDFSDMRMHDVGSESLRTSVISVPLFGIDVMHCPSGTRANWPSFPVSGIKDIQTCFSVIFLTKIMISIAARLEWANGELVEFYHDDVIKWEHLLRYWPFVQGIFLSPVNYPHKGQWRSALMFFFKICAWKNRWVNNRDSAHHGVTVMIL